MHIEQLKPLQRQALLAGLQSLSHSFERRGKAFVPRDTAQLPAPEFTHRLINMLDRDYLVTLDDPNVPRIAKLTSKGVALANALKHQLSGMPAAAFPGSTGARG